MNLGASLGFDMSASSSAGMSSPFSVTGGGGSAAVSTGAASPITGTGTPSGVAAWLPWAAVAVVAIAIVALMLKRKRKG